MTWLIKQYSDSEGLLSFVPGIDAWKDPRREKEEARHSWREGKLQPSNKLNLIKTLKNWSEEKQRKRGTEREKPWQPLKVQSDLKKNEQHKGEEKRCSEGEGNADNGKHNSEGKKDLSAEEARTKSSFPMKGNHILKNNRAHEEKIRCGTSLEECTHWLKRPK